MSIDFRRWREKVSGLRRPSDESPDFSSGLLLRNWRVVIVGRLEWFENVGDGGAVDGGEVQGDGGRGIGPESEMSDTTGELGPSIGECGDGIPDG